jgi:hypothetical protein
MQSPLFVRFSCHLWAKVWSLYNYGADVPMRSMYKSTSGGKWYKRSCPWCCRWFLCGPFSADIFCEWLTWRLWCRSLYCKKLCFLKPRFQVFYTYIVNSMHVSTATCVWWYENWCVGRGVMHIMTVNAVDKETDTQDWFEIVWLSICGFSVWFG